MSLSVLIYIKYYVNDKFMPFWVVICHVNKSFTLPVYPIFYTVLYLRVFSCSLMPGWLFVTPCPSGSSVHAILQTRILEWVAIPFPRGSPRPRDQTQVSCIASRFFTVWATREAPWCKPYFPIKSHSEVLGIRTSIVRGHNSIYNTVLNRFVQ